jgi:hypothetical protein
VEQQPAEGSSDAQGELAADRKLLNQVMTEWILMRAGSRRTGILLRFCSLCARCGAPNAPDPLWWVLRWRSVPPPPPPPDITETLLATDWDHHTSVLIACPVLPPQCIGAELAAGKEALRAVSHCCACIGSPCLKQCVHGASI